MKVNDIRSKFVESLYQCLSLHGFKAKGNDVKFLRERGGIINEFRVGVHSKTGWFLVMLEVGVTCRRVNDQLKKILGYKTTNCGVTIGFGIESDFPGRGTYHLETEESLTHIASLIESDFLEVALPYFESKHDLESVEKALNQTDSEGNYIPLDVPAACKGLIAAKLCGRTDIEALADFHYNYLITVQGKELAAPILRVKEYLLRA